MDPNLVHGVAEEFTRDGLKEFVMNSIDGESYSDEPARRVVDEFLYRLGQEALNLGDTLAGSGVEFFWAVNMGYAGISPMGSGAHYRHTSGTTVYEGLDAILAFLRDGIDIDAITDEYWEERHASFVQQREVIDL